MKRPRPTPSEDQQQRLAHLGEASQQVFALLLEADRPLRPYELVFRLQAARGRSTPPSTVYRATGLLLEVGLAHRVTSGGAFVACSGACASKQPAFLICERCGAAEEVAAESAAALIDARVRDRAFAAARISISVHGVCQACGRTAARRRGKS